MTATLPDAPNLRIRPIRAFSDNYIWIIDNGKHAVVVDPGDAMPVFDALESENLSLAAILLTHHHHDHVGGVLELLKDYKATVYGPALENLPACDVAVAEGDSVTIESLALTFNVLDVPGHTAGHVAYTGQVGKDSVLFCGDTLFVGGCGRLFEGTPAQMLASLDKFAALPESTKIYCAHEYTLSNLRWARTVEPGNLDLAKFEAQCTQAREHDQPTVPSSIATEKACNPFMRARQASVAKAANHWADKVLANPVEVFAALRTWKNEFR
ncbi:MAG: hydroxyacylglutathione hydrolase [Burkholderiaceae bacterium]|nr:hydroxyacylglutathione hydrolase [Burkholderiaceae bacterium]